MIARSWQLGAVPDNPVTGIDLKLAIDLADRMKAASEDPFSMIMDLRYIETQAIVYFMNWRQQKQGAG